MTQFGTLLEGSDSKTFETCNVKRISSSHENNRLPELVPAGARIWDISSPLPGRSESRAFVTCNVNTNQLVVSIPHENNSLPELSPASVRIWDISSPLPEGSRSLDSTMFGGPLRNDLAFLGKVRDIYFAVSDGIIKYKRMLKEEYIFKLDEMPEIL